MGLWVVFVLEFRNETDVFFDALSLLFHAFNIVGAFLMVDSFEHFLVFLNNPEEFLFPKRLMEGAVESGVGLIVILVLKLEVGALIAWIV